MASLLKSARYYRDKCGFSVIPLLKNKRPAIEWAEFQKRKATDEELKQWFSVDCMLGIVCGSISNLSVVDVDNDDGRGAMEEYVSKDFLAPTVYTPRGGYHLYCRYVDGVRNKAGLSNGIDIRGEGGYVVAPPSINDEGKEYKWDKEKRIDKLALPMMPTTFLELEYIPKTISMPTSSTMFSLGRRDNDLFHVSNLLIKGGANVQEAQEIVSKLAQTCDPPFPIQEVNAKVGSAIQRAMLRERHLAQEVKDWIASSKGIFLSSEVSKALQIYDKDSIKEMARVLNRLAEEGYIERYGKRAGVFRKIERDYREMDWLNAKIKPLAVSYPLGLSNVFVTYAKNVIVVAGVKDSGKTAFFLDFIKRNHNKFKINYFTNEMGDEELAMRIRQHKDIKVEEWNFKAYEMGGAWEDIIAPNDITIVDYIEINENFWEIGESIKKMHEKLNKGILLLGLQKAYGQLLGRGKEFSIQRPRLYVTLEGGIATIISAKNRIPDGHNVAGWTCDYDIVDGWKIVSKSPWHSPQGE